MTAYAKRLGLRQAETSQITTTTTTTTISTSQREEAGHRECTS